MSNKIVIINNYATPYREDLFSEIQENSGVNVVYVAQPEAKRRDIGWRGAKSQRRDVFQLNDPTIVQRSSGRRLIVPIATIRRLVHMRPKIIVCSLSRDMVLVQISALVLARITKAKIAFWVGDVSASPPASLVTGLIDRLRMFCARKANGFIFYSTKSRSWLQSRVPETASRTSWIGGQVRHPIAAMPTQVQRPERPIFRLLFVGGETPRKGLAELVDDLARRPTVLGRRVEILCVGGAQRGCKRRAGIRVISLGKLDAQAMQRAYQLADAAIIASLDEPWGFVFNEAILAGTACVVSTNAGAGTVASRYGLAYEIGKSDTLNRALVHASSLTRTELGAIADELSVAKAAHSFHLFMMALTDSSLRSIQDY